MKCIIAGSRRFPTLNLNNYQDWKNPTLNKVIYDILEKAIKESGFLFNTVVSGTCWGMDQLGEQWAHQNPKIISTILQYPAEWDKYGKASGPIRNNEMAKAADCLVCIHTKNSAGSLHMISAMKKLNKPLFSFAIG